MKADRRTILLGAVIIGGAVLLSARQGQRPTCAGGSCCPLPINLSGLASNSWPTVESTNAKPAQTVSEPLTNHWQ